MRTSIDIGGLHEEESQVRSAWILGSLQKALARELVVLPILADYWRTVRLICCSYFLIEADETKPGLPDDSRSISNHCTNDEERDRPYSIEPTLPFPAFFLGSQVIEVAVCLAGKAMNVSRRLAIRSIDVTSDISEVEELAHVLTILFGSAPLGEHGEDVHVYPIAALCHSEKLLERLLELGVQSFHVLSFLACAATERHRVDCELYTTACDMAHCGKGERL